MAVICCAGVIDTGIHLVLLEEIPSTAKTGKQ
jgi:hypothetical protein